MINITRIIILPLTLLAALVLSGCSDGGDSPPPTGTLNITIVDGTTAAPQEGIADARVILLDAESAPVKTYDTNADGVVNQSGLLTGDYQLKISAQGYNSSPAPRVPPLPVKINLAQTTMVTIELFPIDPLLVVGAISGKVSSGGNTVSGALIIAKVAGDSYTTISATDGSYILNNVAEGSADITAYFKGLNFPVLSAVAVTFDTTTTGQDLVASAAANGTISGNVQFVAGGTAQTTDITLIDRETREIIPGMRVYTNANDHYTMSGLPDGTFEIIASMLNDGNVIDPDESVTQGDPLVDVVSGVVTPTTRDFKVTGAVELDTPSTPVNNEVPVLTATPAFTWHSASSYSSANNFAIEVVNESGATVWGGFGGSDPVAGIPTEIVPGGTYTIDYAGPALQSGRYYQLRIYAMKDVTVSADYPQGYKLISVTENLDGVFKVE
jgi:5-hydroxyisourate hydrolase-like protein (transthyretin family)